MINRHKRLWIGLIILVILSPIGIILPERFHAKDPWGEWDVDTLEKLIGYVPEGLKKYSGFWKAPISDYNFGGEDASMGTQLISYVISGLLGILLSVIVVYLVSRLLVKHEK